MGGFSKRTGRRANARAVVVGVMALIALVVFGTPAAAAPMATIDPATVSAGDEVTISGAGWTPDRGVFLVIEANGTDVFFPNALAGSDGSFSVTHAWPVEIPPGDHVLSVSGTAGDGFLDLPITVVGDDPPPISAPTVSVSPSSVAPGGEITISGTGWDICCTIGITLELNGTDFAGTVASTFAEFDRTFSVTGSVPTDIPPGNHVIRVFGSAGDFDTPVDAALTVLGVVPLPEPQPPVVSASPPGPEPDTGPGGTEVAGSTQSSLATDGSTSELPRTGASAWLAVVGVALLLAGALLVHAGRGNWVLRRAALARVVALVAVAALAVAACGDDGDDNGDASDEETEEPAEADEGDEVDVAGLDYTGALFTIEDVEGLVPGDYVSGADEDPNIAGFQLRSLCGQDRVGPEAAEGEQLPLDDADETLSFTTSVQAFDSVEEAETAFELSNGIAEQCDTFISESSGNQFARAPEPGISESGDESFDLFARNTESGLLVGDHIVRQGQFVFDVRIIRLSTSPYSDAVLATLADEASEKFLDWVEAEAG